MINKKIDSLHEYKYLICLDTETTGLSPKDNQIIELAYVVYENKNGKFEDIAEVDDFISLEPGKKLPEEIINLTHITDEMLEKEGISKLEASMKLLSYLNLPGKKIFAAYNAKFDKDFVAYTLGRLKHEGLIEFTFKDLVFIDILTIYRDRAPFPCKLETAITHYNLDNEVKNSHRAIDDTLACAYVLFMMAEEKDDISSYINLMGYNPKYPVIKKAQDPINYKPQDYISDFVYKKEGFKSRIPLYSK